MKIPFVLPTPLTRNFRFKSIFVTSLALLVICVLKLDLMPKDSFKTRGQQIEAELEVVKKMETGKTNTIYEERKNNLLNACSLVNVHKHANNSETTVRDHFVVDRRNKILFCGMEKVGCTFWKRVFQITTGVKNKKNPYDIPGSFAHDGSLETFRKLHFDEILELVNSFTKFIFVREPYSRIFSGYVNKLFSPNAYYFNLRKEIVTVYGKSHDSDCAPYVSFRDFFSYILKTLRSNNRKDGHFVPMYDHCRPCALKYDIIGKMETFNSDVEYLLESQNLKLFVEVNLTGQSTEIDTIKDTFQMTFRQRGGIERCMPFLKSLKLVWRNLQIRGVIETRFLFPSQFREGHVPSDTEIIYEAIKCSKLSNPIKKKENRREALAEAFRSVFPKDLAEYRDIFLPDFKLFGYDIEPKDVFSEDSKPSDFSYFKI